MEPATNRVSPDLARVVLASHILSYRNPHTGTLSYKDKPTASATGYQDLDSDEDEGLDEDIDVETATQIADLLTPCDIDVREKFLSCVAELLSHSKGGATVTAAALREKEDSVEVDLSRNGGFAAHDETYLASLTKFLASADTVDTTVKEGEMEENLQSFLDTTVDYNANRLDFWIQKANFLMKDAPLHLPIPKSTTAELNVPYVLPRRAELQRPIPSIPESLLLKTKFWHVSRSGNSQPCAERRKIVAMSYFATGSLENTRIQLRLLVPSADPSKILVWWRLLARTVVNLCTLTAIAKLLPNFRTVRFIPLRAPPPIKLPTNQIPRMAKAWKRLDLPYNSKGSIPAPFARKAHRFKDDCSRELTVHCEVQLLMRYEADPSLVAFDARWHLPAVLLLVIFFPIDSWVVEPDSPSMEPATNRVSPDLARVVLASHILSYRNPHTGTLSYKDKPTASATGYQDLDSDEDEGLDEDIDVETATQIADLLTPCDIDVREKFLSCVAELLSHSKGGATVTAAALREKEDSVEVDLSRNGGFGAHDETYLASLTKFLASADTVDTTVKEGEMEENLQSFLDTTVDYNANRLDFWIQKANFLMKDAPLHLPIPKSTTAELNVPYVLPRRAELQRPIPSIPESLLLKTKFWHVSRSGNSQPCAERRKIVAMSYFATGSLENTRIQLRLLVPSADPSKILVWWRLLARTVVNLCTLTAIAKLLPNFRTVRFIPLRAPPPIKLPTNQIPRMAKAWKRLDLPYNSKGSIPAPFARKAHRFKDDCSRELTVHCEVQLLMRYEADPSLVPTLPFFGCSKKACFLCDAFLARSPLKPRIRGRHGVCHTNWAVPLSCEESIMMRNRLTELCSIIREKIMSLIEPGFHLARRIVHQSSAVSELKTDDMLYLSRAAMSREAVERTAKEHRERMQTLYYRPNITP
ncbi:hypothetical protein MAJ_09161, partial [Metarhizium majus ARSEF 297]